MGYVALRVVPVYGNDLVYPASESGLTFAKMLKVKTFNRSQVECMKALGFEIKVVQGVLPWGV